MKSTMVPNDLPFADTLSIIELMPIGIPLLYLLKMQIVNFTESLAILMSKENFYDMKSYMLEKAWKMALQALELQKKLVPLIIKGV